QSNPGLPLPSADRAAPRLPALKSWSGHHSPSPASQRQPLGSLQFISSCGPSAGTRRTLDSRPPSAAEWRQQSKSPDQRSCHPRDNRCLRFGSRAADFRPGAGQGARQREVAEQANHTFGQRNGTNQAKSGKEQISPEPESIHHFHRERAAVALEESGDVRHDPSAPPTAPAGPARFDRAGAMVR
ncbi:MAG: hypothetical protein RL091_1756, partial [Verrucomicrobiota bacterium]